MKFEEVKKNYRMAVEIDREGNHETTERFLTNADTMAADFVVQEIRAAYQHILEVMLEPAMSNMQDLYIHIQEDIVAVRAMYE